MPSIHSDRCCKAPACCSYREYPAWSCPVDGRRSVVGVFWVVDLASVLAFGELHLAMLEPFGFAINLVLSER